MISHSTPDNIIGVDDAQELIAYCARVSNPSNQNNKDTSEKLIKYLIKHKHWFQEFSQRYADPVKELDFIRRGARLQDPKNRQNSIDAASINVQDMWDMKQQEVIKLCKEVYKWAIDEGIAKEQARAVLPEGMTVSRMYMNGTLRSWVHYIDLRSANGTQKEHQDIAIACAREITKIFPIMEDIKE